jgi:hypothetical protein
MPVDADPSVADSSEAEASKPVQMVPRWQAYPRIVGTLDLDSRHTEAAELLAEGSTDARDIARQVGVSYWTLWAWRQRPEFCRLIQDRREFYETEALTHGVALRHQRVRALNDRWQRMKQLIEERAKDMADVPGGSSGLLVRQVKGVGEGDRFREVEYYTTDHGLLREMRQLEEQAARELGQRPTDSETKEAVREIEATAMSTSELLERARQILRSAGELPPEVPVPEGNR